ncbi:MAG: OFA family MFS transporter [Verrucomicrobiota bacterium]
MTGTHKDTPMNRWVIAISGTVLQLCLGTIYAWSYFQKPLVETYHWSNTQVAWVFSLAICCLGLAAAWGGLNLARFGPRTLAMAGGLLYGSGNLLAALALYLQSLPLLYIGFGILGGTGLGLGYVTPVATVAKWFPDKKGLVTGMVIMGFGFGALLMSKVLAPSLMALTGGNLVLVFTFSGVALLMVATACGAMLSNPPPDFSLPGIAAPANSPANIASPAPPTPDAGNPLHSARFWMMWGVFFCNIVAGIAIIGFQSPMLQDLLKPSHPNLAPASLATYGATLIAVSSIFNGLGRFFWGGLSDRIGRVQTFRIILATQVVAFILLAWVAHPWLFAALICYVLLCYGGGFGTMPSFVLDTFGAARMPVVYGAILTAWSAAGIVGPQIVAWLKDHQPARAATLAFLIGAGFLATGFILSLRLSDRAMGNKR